MTDRYAAFKHLKFDRPAERVMRITLDRPERMNSLDWEAHGELTRVWTVIDEDPRRLDRRNHHTLDQPIETLGRPAPFGMGAVSVTEAGHVRSPSRDARAAARPFRREE